MQLSGDTGDSLGERNGSSFRYKPVNSHLGQFVVRFFVSCAVLMGATMQTAAQQSAAQQPTKPRKHAMAMPGMQMGHENHTPASELRTAFVSAWNAGDSNRLAGLFGDSAVVILPSGNFVTGRQSISEFLRGKVSGKSEMSLTSSGYNPSPDLQVEFGMFSESKPVGSTAGHRHDEAAARDTTVEGKYLMVVKRMDSDWKIQEMVFVTPKQNF